uniref:Uncharacterized protein n=1 Tax=Picea glauca TaxID=3330 RepID=A0A117NHE8_PICGL|nr:hypothetical protein ABT39_MTgene5277 [Picea glauca]QHR88852.1 hypothetical protein Q903MT_gene2871 [Picea sitchensis]
MKQLLSPVLGKLLDHLNQGRHKLPHQQNLLNPLLPLLPLHLLVLFQPPMLPGQLLNQRNILPMLFPLLLLPLLVLVLDRNKQLLDRLLHRHKPLLPPLLLALMPACANGSLTGMDPARVLGWLAWLSGLAAGLGFGRAFGRAFLGWAFRLVIA